MSIAEVVQPQREAAVELRSLSKSFGSLRAVNKVDLTVHAGEVHALLGENGAGKSTLMCLLDGLYQPDEGQIFLAGKQVQLASPRIAAKHGVGMVHQHFMLVPTLTVAENVLLGAAHIPWWLPRKKIVERVQNSADRLRLKIDAHALAGDLSVGQQQRAEILRVLHRGARILIMDEPTAVLSPPESEALYVSLKQLAAAGAAVILITHQLEEVRRVADRLTVMRRGQVVFNHETPTELTAEELATAMVGEKVSLTVERPALEPGAARLELQDLCIEGATRASTVENFSLAVRAGEIVGLAGISGNGQQELCEAIAGLRDIQKGKILVDNKDVTSDTVRQRIDAGIRYIPADRQNVGTAPSLNVAQNLLLRRYRQPPCYLWPWLDFARAQDYCQTQISRLQIATTGLEQQVRLLSGGNMQKVIVAREIDEKAKIILALNPTRGLDAWATTCVRRLLIEARGQGAAVLLYSEHLDELLALSDRIAVIAAGRLQSIQQSPDAKLVDIGRQMLVGQEKTDAA